MSVDCIADLCADASPRGFVGTPSVFQTKRHLYQSQERTSHTERADVSHLDLGFPLSGSVAK